MNKYLILAYAFLGAIAIYLIGSWFFRSWKFAKIIARIAPALIEIKPFYSLLELLNYSSHAMERHGPMTRLDEQVKRAKKGITPDGVKGKPVDSGRWSSHFPLFQAIKICKKLWEDENRKTKRSFVVKFNQKIGVVVKSDTKEIIETLMARIVINKQGFIITAFPILEIYENADNIILLELDTEET
jgi:hypothetical protein